MNVAIIGSGSWGVALAIHLAKLGHNIKIWSFDEEEKRIINEERKCKFLKNAVITDNIKCYTNFEDVVIDSDFILHVTPSKFTRNIFKQYKKYVEDKPVIICSKGFEGNSLKRLDEVLQEEKEDIRLAALSGPSYASEVSKKIPTAVILASKDNKLLDDVSDLLMNEYMRIYESNDIIGVEVGGALKNIIAFCAGICVELGYGINSQAALITRGLAEIARLGIKMGAEKETFYGLSGLGDLILTCSSDESRNRRAGRLIGKGKSIEEVKQEIGMTIESIDNIEIAKKLAEKYNVDMPIVNAAYNILYNDLEVKKAAEMLMNRTKKFENE